LCECVPAATEIKRRTLGRRTFSPPAITQLSDIFLTADDAPATADVFGLFRNDPQQGALTAL
jgi:hypothetical protein